MTVRLVAASVWRQEMKDCAFGSAPPLAGAILTALQDVHAGITPRLAAGLAAVLAGNTRAAGPWTSLFAGMVKSLSGAEGDGRALPELRQMQAFGMSPGSNRVYSVLRVALPLVREASEQCGKSYLLHADEIADSVTGDEYREYGGELDQAIRKVTERFRTGRLFHFEHANALSTFSGLGGRLGHVGAKTSLPAIDSLTAALLLDLKPEMPAARWQPQQPPEPVYSPRNQPSPGVREENVEGIRFSLHESDLDHILLSEFISTDEMLLEKVTTRFLVHERRPHQEKMRDALVVGIMPHEVRAACTGSFLKACWADCMARLGLLLANYRLYRTEFRWIEGDTFGRVRDCSFLLQDLARLGRPLVMSERFRRQFLTLLGWLPDFIDTRSEFRRVALPNHAPETDWLEGAWRGQHDHSRWRHEEFGDEMEADEACPEDDGARRPIHLSRFAFVHVMLFLPPDVSAADGSLATGEDRENAEREISRKLGVLGARLGLSHEPRRNLSITTVPHAIRSGEWAFGARNVALIPMAIDSTEQRGKLAGALERAWLDQLVREVWHG